MMSITASNSLSIAVISKIFKTDVPSKVVELDMYYSDAITN